MRTTILRPMLAKEVGGCKAIPTVEVRYLLLLKSDCVLLVETEALKISSCDRAEVAQPALYFQTRINEARLLIAVIAVLLGSLKCSLLGLLRELLI
jgi:hypothetical protein